MFYDTNLQCIQTFKTVYFSIQHHHSLFTMVISYYLPSKIVIIKQNETIIPAQLEVQTTNFNSKTVLKTNLNIYYYSI